MQGIIIQFAYCKGAYSQLHYSTDSTYGDIYILMHETFAIYMYFHHIICTGRLSLLCLQTVTEESNNLLAICLVSNNTVWLEISVILCSAVTNLCV